MSEEAAVPVATEAQPTPPATSEREWMASAAERLQEAANEDKAAETGDDDAKDPEAKEEDDKPKTSPKPKVVDANPDIESFKAQAKKLGYTIDESGAVSIKERAEFREARAKHRERLSSMERDVQAKIQQVSTQWADKLERVEKILAAEASDDPDELAKALGHESWNKLQESRLNRLTDPNFKRIRELEKFKADQEAARVEAQKQWEAQQRQQAQQQAYQQHMAGLSAHMKTSKDPVCQALHDDPNALQIIFQIQRENYDPDTDSTVTPEQAVKMTPKGGKQAFMEHLKGIHSRLDRIFAKKAEAPKPKPSRTSPAPSGAPATTGWAKGSEKDWLKYAREKMDEAASAERKAKKVG